MALGAIFRSSAVAFLVVAKLGLARQYCSVLGVELSEGCTPFSGCFLDFEPKASVDATAGSRILEDVLDSLAVLQRDYFDPDFGTWPSAIDWTGAVAETIVAGTLTTLSRSFDYLTSNSTESWKAKENLVSFYFAQVVNSFFGQDVLSIRGEAYDDILWVVLGWLEAIQLITTHTDLHFPASASGVVPDITQDAWASLRWHGHNWVSAFAHRSRIFWRLGSDGWDTRYCGGGMVWNRRLLPYKNAITNELWISASIAMYEYFPGDNFTAPWMNDIAFPEKDPAHLASAIQGYKWLRGINMTNHRGLFIDGFHIDHSKKGNTECDIRDEMVYTYNQGVVLTGQRGLWAASGIASYLEDGHKLIQSVIKATGWNLRADTPMDDHTAAPPGRLLPWRGLGRGGIMEEECDASGTCSQDAQTFKGIFFHHFTTFCRPLTQPEQPGAALNVKQYEAVKGAHEAACHSYLGWVKHNTLAALGTRDAEGHFGMWWGAGLFGNITVSRDNDGINHFAADTTDYRNSGTPRNNVWGPNDVWLPGRASRDSETANPGFQYESDQLVLDPSRTKRRRGDSKPQNIIDDPNSRGRGRTVETQLGGLAVLRAYWETWQAQRLTE